MTLPKDNKLEISRLAQIYNNTVATYKFYWFVSLLDIVVKEQRRLISFWEIIVGMITEAWYPIHYFRLSFGKSDSLFDRIVTIQQQWDIPIDTNKEDLKTLLIKQLGDRNFKKIIRIFKQNVPYWFLSPWIKSYDVREVMFLSQQWTNNCPYAINGETIEINPKWERYLNDNYLILRDFTFWNLAVFLQKRNPNVPDVPSKLVKPIQRDSLTKQRNFWNTFIEINGPIQCIYTGKILNKNDFDLDHFVPWSFVSHNLLWNLLPANSSINSSKNNNLPQLETYLRPFAKMHHKAIQTIYPKNPNNKLLEDYLTLYNSISELALLSETDFFSVYQKTFFPLVQIAENMGFRYWQNSLNQ